MNAEDFVHLHTHSHFSLLEALPSPKALVARAKQEGAKALALTDNGALYGAVEFYKACKAEEVKPIIGLDAYVAPNRMTDKRPRIDDRPGRLVLIAINDTGYKNLCKISTAGFLDGFYYKPRIDKDFLREHSEGLVALSGAVSGEIPSALLIGDKKKAKQLLEAYQEIFGKDRFFLELIHHPDYPRQIDANTAIKELAIETETPLVVTRNVFYLDPDDREGYEAQMCIMRGRTLEDFRRTRAEDVDLSFVPTQEIIDAFQDVPEALENTKRIANMVEFEMDLGNNYLPIFEVPEGMTDDDYLYDLAKKGLHERYDEITPELEERFEYEMGIIKKMGFPSYFIIVQDFVTWAKDNGVLVGPGRGSAAGSLVSYCLRITDLCPLKYGLLFERFLNPDRISMPDIDLDFADSRRGEVLEYVTQKYGADHVAGIITFGTLKPKAAVRDAARVLGLSFQEADIIAKAVPDPVQGRHTPLAVAIEEHPDLRDMYKSNPMCKRVVDLARKMEGNPRHASQHACGFVIGDIPLVERVPLQAGQREDTALVTQFSLNSAEAAGLVKMDFLGLSNLSVIEGAFEIIEAVHGVKLTLDDIPLDDKKAFELLGRGETTGVFQLESDGMKRYIKDLKPSRFEDIIAMVALYRPGPMQFIDSFIRRKHGIEKVSYEHPLMENSFKETYGIPVYQEQVMQISREMAGFTGGEADTLRKAMGKKIVELMEKMRVKFIEGSVKNGVPRDVATGIFKKLEDFAAYGFNKSHAACYATISYWTAYLKAHYPSCFMAALMNSDLHNIDRIKIEVEECARIGITVLPPDVNESYPGFSVVPESGNIRWGLAAVKNFGDEPARVIVAERKENGLFEDLADFATRIPSSAFNKKSLEALSKSGALDRFENRSRIVHNIDQLLMFNKQARKDQEQNQISMFDFAPDISESKLTLRETIQDSPGQLLSWEKELLGIYISAHPTDGFKGTIDQRVTSSETITSMDDGSPIMVAGVISDIKQILTKKKQEPMAFVRVEDQAGSIELVVFPKTFAKIREQLEPDRLILVAGKVSVRERMEELEHSVLADKVLTFAEQDIGRVDSMLASDMWFDRLDAEEESDNLNSGGLSLIIPDRPDDKLINGLREIFTSAPGHEQVYLLVQAGGKQRKIETEYFVETRRDVLEQIAQLLGAENIMT